MKRNKQKGNEKSRKAECTTMIKEYTKSIRTKNKIHYNENYKTKSDHKQYKPTETKQTTKKKSNGYKGKQNGKNLKVMCTNDTIPGDRVIG